MLLPRTVTLRQRLSFLQDRHDLDFCLTGLHSKYYCKLDYFLWDYLNLLYKLDYILWGYLLPFTSQKTPGL